MSQQAGLPFQGDTPSFAVDTSYGTAIEAYEVVQISPTTSTKLFVGLCATADTERINAIGVAFKSWQYPPDPRIYLPSGRTSTDLSSGYDPTKYQTLSVRLEGVTWVKVAIESGGSNMTVVPGDRLIPSNGVPGAAMPLTVGSKLTASYASADVIDELNENNMILGRALHLIHIPATGESWAGLPSLQGATPVATLTALTNAITYGYVPMKLGKW